jgi:poly(3-hydroxybutyrate) depolymerase
VLFVKNLLRGVGREFCVDLNRVYLHGESNGAELVQHLVREMPDRFAGIAPWFGTPLLGFLVGRNSRLIRHRSDVAQISFLSLHGRQDVTIPPAGGVTYDGWIFEPEREVSNVWAALNDCDSYESVSKTRWDGGHLNFSCVEHLKCASTRRVMRCAYDGVHGDWPTGQAGDEITLWFLLPFARNPSVNDIVV